MSTYKLISSDSHIIEPPDLWEKHIEPKFRDRAPFLAHEETTDQWYADGGKVKFGTFANAQPGVRWEHPELISVEGRYKDVLAGGLDPHAHVADMDLDGVAGGVLYPSMGLTLYCVPDDDLLTAIFRAYNDWLADFCSVYPKRLKGIAMLNMDDVDEGVKELERAANMGLGGAMMALLGKHEKYDHPDYERLWAAAQDLDIPISLHTACLRVTEGSPFNQIHQSTPEDLTNHEYHARNAIAQIIFSGVFERYPKLKIGAIEFEILWAPYFMGRMDNTYRERTPGKEIKRFKGEAMPSDFFRNNVFISFQEDPLGIRLRSEVGVDNLLWGSDYPHSESTFPRSRQIVEEILEGVPEEEKAKIVGGNTARVYHFD